MPLLMLYSPNVPTVPYSHHHCCNSPRRHPHPSNNHQPKQHKSQVKGYVIDSLTGLGQFYAPIPIRTPIQEVRSAAPRPAVARESRPTSEPSVTQSQAQSGSTDKAKGRKRQKVKKCGRRLGSWIANLCSKGGKKQKGGHPTQLFVNEKQEDGVSKHQSEVEGRKTSVTSEVTLVETFGQHVRANSPATSPHFSYRQMVYAGH